MEDFQKDLLETVEIFAEEDRKVIASLKKQLNDQNKTRAASRNARPEKESQEKSDTLTHSQKEALDVLKSGCNVFLDGKAGTGKSFLTRLFLQYLYKKGKSVLVCAPTGIAALNIGGATLHLTFGVPVRMLLSHEECEDRKKMKVIDRADVILIDEISMCRIDLFGFVARSILSSEERTGKKKQVVVVGDFHQLPPVLKSEEKKQFLKEYSNKLFAFESRLWDKLEIRTVELQEVVRQTDKRLIEALNNIRCGKPDFECFLQNVKDDPEAISICATNNEAQRINSSMLEKLRTKREYKASMWGAIPDVPTLGKLTLAIGAHVIMLTNDEKKRWMNGTLGKVTKLHTDTVSVLMDNGGEYEVSRHTWEAKEYVLRTGANGHYIEEDTIGQFTQFPMKLAWAITIHKSQGQTFEKVNIHPEGIFSDGQLYVALSRGQSIDGIRIVGELKESHLKMSQKVVDFYGVNRSPLNTLLTTFPQKAKKVVKNEKGSQEKVKSFVKKQGNETREKILRLVIANPVITSTEIAAAIGIYRSAVQKHLEKLKKAGVLIRTGSKKRGQWWWIKSDPP